MATQTTFSSLATRLAGRSFSAANEKHKGKPINTGFQRLPGGMKNAVARISSIGIGVFKDDKNGPGTQGMEYFYAKATVVFSGNASTPAEHKGIRVMNQTTTLHSSIHKMMPFIPLCDMPAKGNRKPSAFDDNFFDCTNFLKMCGYECPYTRADDPTSVKTLAFLDDCIKKILDPTKPVYITFSTHEWVPPLSVDEVKQGKKLEDKEPMLFETWHGKTEWKGLPGPAGGVALVSANGTVTHDAPPTMGPDGLAIAPPGEAIPPSEASLEEEVNALLETSKEDSDAGRAAEERLNQLAMAQGWTDEQVKAATSWEDVADMALTGPQETTEAGLPTVGSTWNYVRRDGRGDKVLDKDKKPFPSQEVTVTSVDEAAGTCTIASKKDGKPILDTRTRKPQHVKFEWLE